MNLFVFGSCVRMLAVILFQIFIQFKLIFVYCNILLIHHMCVCVHVCMNPCSLWNLNENSAATILNSEWMYGKKKKIQPKQYLPLNGLIWMDGRKRKKRKQHNTHWWLISVGKKKENSSKTVVISVWKKNIIKPKCTHHCMISTKKKIVVMII